MVEATAASMSTAAEDGSAKQYAKLEALDILTIVLYFVFVIAVGLYVSATLAIFLALRLTEVAAAGKTMKLSVTLQEQIQRCILPFIAGSDYPAVMLYDDAVYKM